MNRFFIFLAIMLIATSAWSKGVGNDTSIQASTHPGGILFELKGGDADLQLSVSGPGNIAYARRYVAADSVFLDITNANGKALGDGLYKYEARPIPAITISREESSGMMDRNVLYGKTDAKISPVSGTFRIVHGAVIDPSVNEYDALLRQRESAQ